MPTTLSSRNSGLAGVPSSGMHQSSGSLPVARFTSNNLPTALSQLSHGGAHGHSGMSSRGGSASFSNSMNGVGSLSGTSLGSAAVNNRGLGLGASASVIGSSGPRIASSVGSIGGGAAIGSGINRAANTVAGINYPSLNSSRVNLGPNNDSAGLSVQGPGRPLSTALQQASPQMVSLLGNSFASNVGTFQGQATLGNGQLGSIGLAGDGISNDGIAFDLNDFPQLTTRPTSAGGSQGPLAALRKQGVSSIVQQSQEFSIQNEDFPALPGFKGGSVDFATELHQKEQQHENAIALMQSQHLTMGRSSNFTLGGSYAPHRQQQQPVPSGISVSSTAGSYSAANSADLLNISATASDMFQTSHGISASYHSQVQAGGSPGVGNSQMVVHSLRSSGATNTAPGLGSYDQLVQQYQQHHNQPQFRLGSHQQVSALGQFFRDPMLKHMQGIQAAPDRFGLLGLLSVIRMSDRDLTTLALGTDLTTLGLNLNSRDNLYKTFASPWAEGPTNVEPEFTLPHCYIQQAPRLQPGYFSKFQQDTLFHIFYSMPNDEAQLYAANELCNRGWFYHKEHCMWFTRIPNVEPLVKTNTYERGCYFYFDPSVWETGRKDNFVLYYEMVENRPKLP
eukprot:c26297_g1_i4 orf=870-2729(-)